MYSHSIEWLSYNLTFPRFENRNIWQENLHFDMERACSSIIISKTIANLKLGQINLKIML